MLLIQVLNYSEVLSSGERSSGASEDSCLLQWLAGNVEASAACVLCPWLLQGIWWPAGYPRGRKGLLPWYRVGPPVSKQDDFTLSPFNLTAECSGSARTRPLMGDSCARLWCSPYSLGGREVASWLLGVGRRWERNVEAEASVGCTKVPTSWQDLCWSEPTMEGELGKDRQEKLGEWTVVRCPVSYLMSIVIFPCAPRLPRLRPTACPKSCPSPWHPVSLQLLTLCFSLTPGTHFSALPICP